MAKRSYVCATCAISSPNPSGRLKIWENPSQTCSRCAEFLRSESGDPDLVTRIVPWPGSSATVFVFPASFRRQALRYWRYTGEMVSSRQASVLLGKDSANEGGEAFEQQLLDRLASWSGQPSNHGHLYASGMAASWSSRTWMSIAFRNISAMEPICC